MDLLSLFIPWVLSRSAIRSTRCRINFIFLSFMISAVLFLLRIVWAVRGGIVQSKKPFVVYLIIIHLLYVFKCYHPRFRRQSVHYRVDIR